MIKEINNINPGNNLKEELVTTLKNLIPICNHPAWLRKEIQAIDNRELEDSYCLMSDIATFLARQWMEKQPEIFQENSTETQAFREFIRKCHANIEIYFDATESIEETTNRVLNEMYQFKNKPTRSTR